MTTEAACLPDLTTLDSRTAAVKRIAKSLLTVERILMGILFVGFGINGFLGTLSTAIAHDGSAALGGALMKASYLFPLLKGTEVLLEVYVKGKA